MKNLAKIKGEFTQRSHGEAAADQRLKELADLNRDAFGPQWNHHSTVFLKRQVLSRLSTRTCFTER